MSRLELKINPPKNTICPFKSLLKAMNECKSFQPYNPLAVDRFCPLSEF